MAQINGKPCPSLANKGVRFHNGEIFQHSNTEWREKGRFGLHLADSVRELFMNEVASFFSGNFKPRSQKAKPHTQNLHTSSIDDQKRANLIRARYQGGVNKIYHRKLINLAIKWIHLHVPKGGNHSMRCST